MNLVGLSIVQAPGRQRGLALVMVLWLLVLLGIIASGHSYNAYIESQLAAMHIQSAKARAAIETGISYAVLQLLTPQPAEPWPFDGTVDQIVFDGAQIRIAIRDASGLIDLNTASPDLLRSLVAALNVEEERQEKIVAAILDWRDPDSLTHLNGAEASDYLSGGYPWTPRNGAFSSVEELRYVMGMTPALFNDMAAFTTVYSEQAGINLEFAAPFLINAMQGKTVMPTASNRSRANPRSAIASGNGTYHIYVSSNNKEGLGASAEAVVRVSGNPEKPYQMMYWRDSMRTRFPEST